MKFKLWEWADQMETVEEITYYVKHEYVRLETALTLIADRFPAAKVRCQVGIVAQLYSKKPCKAETLLKRIPDKDLDMTINGLVLNNNVFVIVL